jgi:hypothetical protein
MNYETPKLTTLTPALSAIQSSSKPLTSGRDSDFEEISAYADWEE